MTFSSAPGSLDCRLHPALAPRPSHFALRFSHSETTSLSMVATNRSRSIGVNGFWVLFCAFCTCSGWMLSACHQLNAAGYAVAFLLAGSAILLARRHLWPERPSGANWRKARRRFRRFFPLAFLSLALLAILGGALYPPSNADALTQRIPRTLNWLAEQRWHWIQNAPGSFNNRACGFEWLMAPMLALLKTDRFVFVLNGVSYLLLPGLLFSMLRRLGVAGRVAWHWMWLAPSGYCFLQQAGSIGNDAFGAMLALAAIDFALRAKSNAAVSDVWLSMLSAALLSGAKTSNLALLLPWFVSVAPSLKLLWLRPLATAGVAAVAAGASFLPTAVLNYHYARDWSGAAAEMPAERMARLNPLVGLVGNALNLTAQNLTPPVFPMADWWNEHAYRALPRSLQSEMEHSFEPGGAHLQVAEIQFEPSAGLGFGVSLLLLVSWIAAWRLRASQPQSRGPVGEARGSARAAAGIPRCGTLHLKLVRWSPFISLLVYMAKLAMSTSARILTPFYALLLPAFLAGRGHETLVRRRWWRGSAVVVFLLALVLVVINPGRPLWPAQRVLSWLAVRSPQSRVISRGKMLYESYAVRWDALAPVREHLPDLEKSVGMISFLTSTTLETSLWRPFGQRRIWWLRADDTLQEITGRGIHYVVIAADSPTARAGGIPLEDWLAAWLPAHRGKVVAQARTRNVATKESAVWYVIECSW